MAVDQAGLRAVAELHHRYLTGVILALVHRQGTARTAEVVRRTFRRQHLEKFDEESRHRAAVEHKAPSRRPGSRSTRPGPRDSSSKFVPGLEARLRGLPDAVACAKYHYLSNTLGGVKVEWIAESDTKSWVRYLPRGGSGTASRCARSRRR